MISDYSKQMELIKTHEFTERINVIGAGALGSWIVFILLKMGFSNIHVYDFDVIEEHNIPNQLFKESQIGKPKVESMLELYKDFFIDVDDRLIAHCNKVTSEDHQFPGIMICAVDTMSGRKELYEHLFKYNTRSKLWIEGRLSIYGAYVYTLLQGELEHQERYEKTLYGDAEAEVSACGISQTALPSAINCATIMVMQMIEWHNGNKILNQIEYAIPWMTNMTKEW